MTNPPLSLPLYLLSAPLFYILSLHPYFTPYLPPIYIYPPHALPPFDTPSLCLYSSTLHSLSVLPIYPPLYHPTLQPLSRTHRASSQYYSFLLFTVLLYIPFQQLVQLNFCWASHQSQDNPQTITNITNISKLCNYRSFRPCLKHLQTWYLD